MLCLVRWEYEHASKSLKSHDTEVVLAFCYAGDEPRAWDMLGKQLATKPHHSPPRSSFTRDTRNSLPWKGNLRVPESPGPLHLMPG